MMSQSLAVYDLRECIVSCARFAGGEVHFYPDSLELFASDQDGNYSSPLVLDYAEFVQFKASREGGSLRLAVPFAPVIVWAEANQCAQQVRPPSLAATAPSRDDGSSVEHENARPCYLLLRLLEKDIVDFFDGISGTLGEHFRASRSASRLSVAAVPLRLSAPPSAHACSRSVVGVAISTENAGSDDGDSCVRESGERDEEAEAEDGGTLRDDSLGSHITTGVAWQRRQLLLPIVVDPSSSVLGGESTDTRSRENSEEEEVVEERASDPSPVTTATATGTGTGTGATAAENEGVSVVSRKAARAALPSATHRSTQRPPSISLSDQLVALAQETLEPTHLQLLSVPDDDDEEEEKSEGCCGEGQRRGVNHTRSARRRVPLPRARRSPRVDQTPQPTRSRISQKHGASACCQPGQRTQKTANPTAARDITDEILATFQTRRPTTKSRSSPRRCRANPSGSRTAAKARVQKPLQPLSSRDSAVSDVPVLALLDADVAKATAPSELGEMNATNSPLATVATTKLIKRTTAGRERQTHTTGRHCDHRRPRRGAQLCASQESVAADNADDGRPHPRRDAARDDDEDDVVLPADVPSHPVSVAVATAATPPPTQPDTTSPIKLPDASGSSSSPPQHPGRSQPLPFSQDELRGRALTILMIDEEATESPQQHGEVCITTGSQKSVTAHNANDDDTRDGNDSAALVADFLGLAVGPAPDPAADPTAIAATSRKAARAPAKARLRRARCGVSGTADTMTASPHAADRDGETVKRTRHEAPPLPPSPHRSTALHAPAHTKRATVVDAALFFRSAARHDRGRHQPRHQSGGVGEETPEKLAAARRKTAAPLSRPSSSSRSPSSPSSRPGSAASAGRREKQTPDAAGAAAADGAGEAEAPPRPLSMRVPSKADDTHMAAMQREAASHVHSLRKALVVAYKHARELSHLFGDAHTTETSECT